MLLDCLLAGLLVSLVLVCLDVCVRWFAFPCVCVCLFPCIVKRSCLCSLFACVFVCRCVRLSVCL